MASANPFKRTWHLLVVNLVAAFIVMLIFSKGWHSSFKAFSITYFWNFSIFITQWAVIVYANAKIEEYISWQDKPILRALLLSVGVIILSPLVFMIVNSVLSLLFVGGLPHNSWEILRNVTYVAFGATLFFSAIGFFKAWKASLIETEKVKSQMLAYKYESLQNQINPHFLFNSFNVLTDLVYEDQNKAVKFIKQLSQLFRYVLESRDKELVPIIEEMEFTESFAYLLQTRFEDKLTIATDLHVEPEEMIVPMTMQLLIENCVKHNEISTQKPLNISISRNNGFIEVVNNIQYKNVGSDSKKTGLSNIKQQFSYFTDQKIIIEQTEDYFSVQVPIIKVANK
ncbi:MAG: histidine kinase [Salinivirgaceae bacterium]|jgi:two-component system LytT family sensor kinase|nr:histidine kinase [Salinivirgaceae bacterium]